MTTPYVIVRIDGHDEDNDAKHTPVTNSNGLNPSWNTVFEFEIRHREFATLSMLVYHDAGGRGADDNRMDDFLGVFSIPITVVKQGYRLVPLSDQVRTPRKLPALGRVSQRQPPVPCLPRPNPQPPPSPPLPCVPASPVSIGTTREPMKGEQRKHCTAEELAFYSPGGHPRKTRKIGSTDWQTHTMFYGSCPTMDPPPPGTCFNFHSDRGGDPPPSPPPPSAQVHPKTWVLGTFFSHGKKFSAPSAHAIHCVHIAPCVLHIPCFPDYHAPTLVVSVFQLPGPTAATRKTRRRN